MTKMSFYTKFIKSIKWIDHPRRMKTKSIKWMSHPRRIKKILSIKWMVRP